MFAISSKLNSGNATMYDVIQWMLETWKGRKGKDSNLEKLIEILEIENLQNAAGNLNLLSSSNSLECAYYTKHPMNCCRSFKRAL